jgi:general secretion pathway protein C
MGEAGDYSGGRFLGFLAAVATLAASSLLAAVVAWWGWQLVGPAPVHIVPAPPVDPAATLVAANLFGTGSGSAVAGAPGSEATLAGNARLLGIIAEPQQQGYALFSLPGGPKVVAAGQEISPGVKITAIAPDTVTVQEGAAERRLRLRPEPRAAAGARTAAAPPATGVETPAPGAAASGVPVGAAPVPSPAAVASASSCAPPAGFRGPVIRLNAELLGGLSSDTAPWRTLFAPTPQGLVVTQESGYSAMLGLKAGDRIAQANGIALRSPDDVTSAVLRPLIANQGVRIAGLRDGAPQELWLANAACAQ